MLPLTFEIVPGEALPPAGDAATAEPACRRRIRPAAARAAPGPGCARRRLVVAAGAVLASWPFSTLMPA